MIFIAHRINTKTELKNVPLEYGVELDLRDRGERLIIQHNPFEDGEDFEDYLKEYNHKLIILNIKSERIEYRVLELIKKYGVKDYFFLDSSFPMIYQLTERGEKNIALRFSEFESLESIMTMKGKCNWVWVDSFKKLVLTGEQANLLKSMGFKLCLVSPELQGRQEDIESYKEYIKNNKIEFDAICTKIYNIEKWRQK